MLVDEQLRASDPHVFAAGDVANAGTRVLGRRLRVEHWDTAIEQGRVAAAQHARQVTSPTTRLPYFFTDQYDLGMEYVGNVGPDGYDQVVVRATWRTRSRRSGSRTGASLPDARQRLGRHRPDPRARRTQGAARLLADGSVDLAALAKV